MKIVDEGNAKANGAAEIAVGTGPLVAYGTATPSIGVGPLAVQFSATATGGTPPIAYDWQFGDGGTSTAADPAHTYTGIGTYLARLNVTDAWGDHVSTVVSVTVAPVLSATAVVDPQEGTTPLTVRFNATAEGGAGGNLVAWSFGDGSSANQTNVSHVYALPGSYAATFTVSDRLGDHVSLGPYSITVSVPAARLYAALAAWPNPVVLGHEHMLNVSTAGGAPPLA